MAVAFRARSFLTNTSANSTATAPAGTVSGDVMVAYIATEGTGANAAPSGWTTLDSGSNSTVYNWRLAYIVRGGSAPAMNFTNPATYHEIHILTFSGVDNTTPIDASVASGALTVVLNPDPPSVTAIAATDMAVACGVAWAGSSAAWGAPAGYTMRSDNTAGNDVFMATKPLSGSGAENPAVFTGSAGTGGNVNTNVALLLAASSGTTFPQAITVTATGTATQTRRPNKLLTFAATGTVTLVRTAGHILLFAATGNYTAAKSVAHALLFQAHGVVTLAAARLGFMATQAITVTATGTVTIATSALRHFTQAITVAATGTVSVAASFVAPADTALRYLMNAALARVRPTKRSRGSNRP